MKQRTGKECKKVKCVNYETYTNWMTGSSSERQLCMDCKNAYLSQYKIKEDEK